MKKIFSNLFFESPFPKDERPLKSDEKNFARFIIFLLLQPLTRINGAR